MKPVVELMSPAATLAAARTAFQAGADSIYVGVKDLSLRPRKFEPSCDEFKACIDYAHSQGKLAYAVLNVFLKPEDIKNFQERVEEVYKWRVDGVIVADIGVISYIHQNYPDLPIHISVQNSVTNSEAAKFYEELGASVIVVSRSVSDLQNIAAIKRSVRADIEVFIHGGICYLYDGNCMMSSYFKQEKIFDEFLGIERLMGQNNAKGECHLICKRPCTLTGSEGILLAEGRLLRRPDLVGFEDLPKYIEIGVRIFKIEGRAMPLSYIEEATRVYRQAINLYFDDPDKYSFQEEWRPALQNILQARLDYERQWRIR